MSRPQKCRKIFNPPKMQGFRPYGMPICETEQVIITYDEFETIRLVCYENLSQTEAAKRMEISRPTLTRIFMSVQKKISTAFIEGKSILIEGGNFEFEKDWYKCKRCNRLIEGLENHVKCNNCKGFGTSELINLNSPKNE